MSTAFQVLAVVAFIIAIVLGIYLFMVSREDDEAASEAEMPPPAFSGELARAMQGEALLFFYSTTCEPSAIMLPIVTALAEQDERVYLIDVDEDAATADTFGVTATPTTVRLWEGEVQEAYAGELTQRELEIMLGYEVPEEEYAEDEVPPEEGAAPEGEAPAEEADADAPAEDQAPSEEEAPAEEQAAEEQAAEDQTPAEEDAGEDAAPEEEAPAEAEAPQEEAAGDDAPEESGDEDEEK